MAPSIRPRWSIFVAGLAVAAWGSAGWAGLSLAGPLPPGETPRPESEGFPDSDGTIQLADGARLVTRRAQVVLIAQGTERVLATEQHAPAAVSADGRFAVLTHREADAPCPVLDLLWLDGTWRVRRLVAEGCPDRAAIDPAGRRVAYVGESTGIASIYLISATGGPPVQLTNRDLGPPALGQPPRGFVAPPHLGPPRFVGDRLVWDAPDGPHEVRLP